MRYLIGYVGACGVVESPPLKVGVNYRWPAKGGRLFLWVCECMGRVLGYMVTWRTYGTWRRVPEGGCLQNPGGPVEEPVRLGKLEKELVRAAILEEVKRADVRLEALAVYSSHVHVVVGDGEYPVDEFVALCKTAARSALHSAGIEGRVWAYGYDKRFCFDREALLDRIAYVEAHAREYND